MGGGLDKTTVCTRGEGEWGGEGYYRLIFSITDAGVVVTVHGVFSVPVRWDSVSTMMNMYPWHTNALFRMLELTG